MIIIQENDTFKIVAGERRWRAARLAGLQTVPVIVKELSGRQVMEIALIENLQREDLNPIEEAEAYERLITEYGMTQEEISKVVGKSRPAIANSIRLLSLQAQLKSMVIEGVLSGGHARTLLPIDDVNIQMIAVEEIKKKELNVRETEALVKKLLLKRVIKKPIKLNEEYQILEEKLREYFATRVKITRNNKKGKIVIEYYSPDELERIVSLVEKSIPKSENA